MLKEGKWDFLLSATEKIEDEFRKRLTAINDGEVAFTNRKVELLWVGHRLLVRGPFEIHSLAFKPDPLGNGIVSCRQCFCGAGTWAYAHNGDDEARQKISVLMKARQNDLATMEAPKLRSFVGAAITAGIRRCGTHPIFCGVPACGGTPRVKTLD